MIKKDNSGKKSPSCLLLNPYLPLTLPLRAPKRMMYLFAVLAMLLFGGWNTQAWGACTYIDSNASSIGTYQSSSGWHGIGAKYKFNAGNDIYTLSSLDNKYGVSAISCKVSLASVTGGKSATVVLQYKVGTGSWTNVGSAQEIKNGKNQTFSAENLSIEADKAVSFRVYVSSTTEYGQNRTLNTSLTVTMKTTASMPSTLDIGSVAVDGSDNNKMNFTHSNRNGQTITFSSDQSAFKVSPSSIKLGCSGSEEITVTYKPTCGNKPTSATITAKYGTTVLSTTKVSATPTLVSQSVNWGLGNATSLVAGTELDIAGFATSTSDIDGKPAIYYSSSDSTVINVAKDGHTLIANDKKAGYWATITAHQTKDCKYGDATANQVFTVTAKDRPTFTLYVNGEATEDTVANLLVGDTVEIHYEHAPNLQVGGGSSTTFTHSENTVSKIVTVIAQGVCTNGKLTLYQSGTAVVEERTAKFTFNISKHETSLSSLLDVTNFYVGNSVYDATEYNFANNAAYTTNNSEVPVQFSSTDENVINVANGKIKALKAGKATVTISQPKNYKWTGDTVEQTITVKKHAATFGWNVNANYTWNQSISNPFTTDNHDTQITCVSDDTNVADYVDGKVVIYNVTATAHFTLHQDSSDVWAETSQQYTVNVTKVNKHVPFTINQALYNTLKDDSKSSGDHAWDGGIRLGNASDVLDWDDKYVVIGPFEGVPAAVYCDYSCSDAATGRDWRIYESSDGSNWGNHICKSTDAGSFSQALSPTTKYLKFYWTGNCAGYFSNIKVTERREVKAVEKNVDCGTANHGEDATEGKAILEWYNVKPLTCSITSEHPEAFELVTTSINSRLDTYKKNQEITVRGKHDVPAGTYTGVLHVSNGIESTTFNLTTTTTKQTPVISWKNNLSPLSVGDVVADAASAGSAPIHYTVDGLYLTLNEQGAVVATNATDENGIDLIAYVIEDETWYAQSETIKVVVTNLEKQTINWTDKLSLKFMQQTEITLTASASSNLPMKYELSGTGSYAHLNSDSSKLVVTGIGKTLYLTAKQEGDAVYYPASQTKLINSRDPNATCDYVLYEDYSETTLHTIDWKEIEWNLSDGEPGRITFYIKRGTAAAGNMAIEEYYDNGWHRIETYGGLSTSYGDAKVVNLNRKSTKISIGAPTGATLRHYVDDIVLYQAKYIEGIPSVRDFGTVTMGTAQTMTFDVKYSNLSKSLDLEIKNENSHFSVDRTYIGDDCGEHGTVTVTVTYTASEYRNTQEIDSLIISNSENRFAVALKANVQRASQTITWNPNLSLNTTDVVAFDAVTTDAAAATGIEVKYEVTEGNDVATVTEDGHLTIIKNGTVKVKAYAEGNSQYEDATDVVKTFTISKVDPTITNQPTINAITLPATLSNVAIGTDATAEDDKHNAVTGSFAWQTETTKVLSGANDYTIVFTPDQPAGKDWYNEVVYNIPVTGNKGDQSITWTRADVTTQPCSTPTTFDAYSNKGLPITYESDREDIAHVEKVDEEYRLVVTTSGTVHITAKQAGNGDYNAAEDVTKTISLTREQPVITTPPTADTIYTDNLLNEAGLSGGEGQVNGVHADGIFAWKNGNIQPEYGIHSYTVTFTPSPAEWYYPAECQVSVTVNKHPHSLSWAYAGGTIYVDKDDLYFSGATSSVELDNIYYTTSNAAVAEVDAEQGNKLIIHGKGTIEVIARSEGNSNYYAAEQRKTLTILPLVTTVMANPAAEHAITYGQALNATAVVGGTVKGSDDAVLEGTWAWNNGAETLNAGNDQVRGVTFTPNDSHWYATATSTATVNVNKATPEEMANNVAVTYGTAALSVTLSGSGNGTWSWNDSRANETLDADHYSLDVRFTPNDGNNYNVQNTTVQVTVNPATPDLAWTKAPTECLTTDANVSFAAASEASTGAISYEIVSGTGVSIDATSGVLTITEAGTVTIQATIAATQNYESRSITTSLTITPPNVFTNADRDGDWNNPNNWSTGEKPEEEVPDVVVSGELVIDGEVTVGNLTIEDGGSVTLTVDGSLTVNGETEDREKYGDIHVKETGNLVLGNTAALKVNDFILDAALGDNVHNGASGQVSNENHMQVKGDVYFQMAFDPSGKISYGWYDFTVPFEVDVNGGIYRLENDGSMTPMTSGVHFIIQNFSESRCAAKTKAWQNYNGTLQPGFAYTVTFDYQADYDQNIFLFKKKSSAALGGSGSYAATRTTDKGNTEDQGWNALGNGTLRHTELVGNTKIQIFNHSTNSYVVREAKNAALAVGTAFQMQVEADQPIIQNAITSNKPLLAPSMNKREVEEFRLSLSAEGSEHEADRLWASASEEAGGEYTIGRDLLKKGTPTDAKVAQMWAEAYSGLKLCDIEMQLKGSDAQTVLGFYAPQAGTYILSADEAPANTSLYLTYNGRVIWNLTYSPYTLDLTKGTTEGYGLKLYVNRIATDIDDVQGDQTQCTKVIIDNQIYIVMPNGAMYDVTGKKVQ